MLVQTLGDEVREALLADDNFAYKLSVVVRSMMDAEKRSDDAYLQVLMDMAKLYDKRIKPQKQPK